MLENLLAEINLLRRESQRIKDHLDRLLNQIDHIEALLVKHDIPVREHPSSDTIEVRHGHTDLENNSIADDKKEALQKCNLDNNTFGTNKTILQRFYRLSGTLFSLPKIIAIAAICSIIYGTSFIGILDWLEILSSGIKYTFKNQTLPSKKIVIVTIDPKSVEELGIFGKQWRQYHGRVLKNLADDGALAIGFDVTFPQNSEFDNDFIDGINYAMRKNVHIVVASEYDEISKTFSPTSSTIKDSVSGIGHTYLKKDWVTNLVRWAPIQLEEITEEGNVRIRNMHPSLTSQLATVSGIELTDTDINKNNYLTIHFQGKKSAFTTYSYAQVFKNTFTPGTYRNKLVLIGTTLPAHKDFYDVPGCNQMPGIEIHAHALATLLSKGIIKMGRINLGIAIIIASFTTVIVFSYCSSLSRKILLPLLLASYWVSSIYYFSKKSPVELNLIYPSMSLAWTWAILSLYEKIASRKAFRHAIGLPEEAINRLETDPEFENGEARKLLTILELDIEKFSVFSRQNSATYVRSLLAEFSAAVEKVIYGHGGYVNKYVGDSVLAVFGYPMTENNCAMRAVKAARGIQQVLKELVEKWKRENKKCFERIRIGINHGYVNISYLGKSKKQLDVIGDNVDLAARLEAEASKHNGIALISLSVHKEIEGSIVGRKVSVNLKNRPDVKEAYILEKFID